MKTLFWRMKTNWQKKVWMKAKNSWIKWQQNWILQCKPKNSSEQLWNNGNKNGANSRHRGRQTEKQSSWSNLSITSKVKKMSVIFRTNLCN